MYARVSIIEKDRLPVGAAFFFLLADGVSFLLLSDGVSLLQITSTTTTVADSAIVSIRELPAVTQVVATVSIREISAIL